MGNKMQLIKKSKKNSGIRVFNPVYGHVKAAINFDYFENREWGHYKNIFLFELNRLIYLVNLNINRNFLSWFS